MIKRALPGVVAALAGCLAVAGAVASVFVGGFASAADEPLDPKVAADARLSAGQSVVFHHTTPLYGAEVFYPPHACRGDARTLDDNAAPLICKAYRVELNLDPNPKALNTVIFEALFEQTRAPSLAVGVAGLNPPPSGGVNIYVWDTEEHYLGENEADDPNDASPGGAGFSDREIGSFVAKQRFYDVVVVAEAGPNTAFDLHVTFSNELFKKPLEILDEFGNPVAPGTEVTPYVPPADTPLVSPPSLAPADVTLDQDIAGIGLGVNEQFDPDSFALPPQTRTIAATDPPSTLALVVGMVLVPFVAGVAAVIVLRRRRHALVA